MEKNNVLTIDIVSDVVCPWCAIGYERLKKAIDKFSDQIDVNVRWHPFELNPNMANDGENLRQHLAAKYGTTLESSIKARVMITEFGKEIGFEFNYFDQMKMFNTHECHQLLLWALETDFQTNLATAMFEQLFTHQGNFSHESLLKIVEKSDLDVEQAKHVLTSQRFSPKVRQIESQWSQKGLNGVPAFIFNNEQMLVGAQEKSTFEQQLAKYIN